MRPPCFQQRSGVGVGRGVLVRVGVWLGGGFGVGVAGTLVGLGVADSSSTRPVLDGTLPEGIEVVLSDSELATERQPAAPLASKRLNIKTRR